MNAAIPLTTFVVASGMCLTVIGAERGQRTVGPPSQSDAVSASSHYTSRNGYFGDLSLIANTGRPRDPREELALAKAKQRTLEALHQALLEREAAIEARLRDLNTASEAAAKELKAQREVIRTREKQVRERLEQAPGRGTPPSTEAATPKSP